MAETGLVINKDDNIVTVKLERKEACAKCRACTASLESKEMILNAENKCNAKIGDTVKISLEQSSFLKAVFIMYCIPLISLLLGIGIGYLVSLQIGRGNNEIIQVVFGLITLGLSYLIIRLNENKWKNKKFRPIAEEIINANN
jgi:sigma-E factor negative regulatory protein RseC